MTVRLRNVQVDVPPDRHDPTVAFWSAALGATPVGHRDEAAVFASASEAT